MARKTTRKTNPAAELGARGGAKGGKARAAKLDADTRSAIAAKAAEARWGLQATHKGKITIGEIEIECAVLEDGRRVITTNSLFRAFGRSAGGKVYRMADEAELPAIVANPRLRPFVPDEIRSLEPIKFRLLGERGQVAVGVEAALLPKICDVWLAARGAGVLHPAQEETAQKAEILVRGLANVGIIALVDEATGYQYQRTRDALAEILEAFISRELAAWVKTFPDDFYRELYRVYGHQLGDSSRRGHWIGKVTADVVYSRLAPGVLEELERKNPTNEKGRRRARHHQYLTRDVGHPKLREHIAQVIALARVSSDKDEFKRLVDRALPKVSTTAD